MKFHHGGAARFTVFALFICIIFSTRCYSDEDYDIAENLISQNDCGNALPILVSVWKSKHFTDQEKILKQINQCAEANQDYKLKASSELLMLKVNPKNSEIQLRLLESLFNLSKHKNVLSYSEKHSDLKNNPDYWILRARSLYELDQNDKAIAELSSLLLKKNIPRKAEIYYWIGQFQAANEDYDLAIESYQKSLSVKNKPKWLKETLPTLIAVLKEKDKKFHLSARLRSAYDNNILRENSKLNDLTYLFDLALDYDVVKKKNKTSNFGIDLSYQGYSKNASYQTSSFSPRWGQSFRLTENIEFEYLASLGKVLTNNKADQNYLFGLVQLNQQLNSMFDVQTAVSYFANLNNNPIKQISFSSVLDVTLGDDLMWLGPVYKKSDSPAPVFDVANYTIPTVVESSMTTRYTQYGLLFGYSKFLTEKSSLQLQLAANQTQYALIDLSGFNSAQVEGAGSRIDLNQSEKVTYKFRYSDQIRLEASVSAIQNTSKGFQGFYSVEKPTNAYDESQMTLGLTYRWPK
jgi:tetratricopeptide (TPR) repeat protein